MEPKNLHAAKADAPETAATLHRQLTDRLAALERHTADDPYGNPIQMLAYEVIRRLDGEISMADIEALVQHLTMLAAEGRAQRLGNYLGEGDPAANRAKLAALVRAAASDGKGGLRPFAQFRAQIERELYGLVITAHPTFGLTPTLLRDLAGLSIGRNDEGKLLSTTERAGLLRSLQEAEHRPIHGITLKDEHRLSVEVLGNIRAALRDFYQALLGEAAQLYPKDWSDLRPRVLTVASWVGYDLDGRADIRWSDSLFKRMRLAALQLAYYRDRLLELGGRADAAARKPLDLLYRRLDGAVSGMKDEVALFEERGAEEPWREKLARLAQRMHERHVDRLTDAGLLIEGLDRALALTQDRETKIAIAVLRAEIGNLGLGMAHTHVRLNATQLHNAIRRSIGIEGAPDDPASRRSFANAINGLLATVERRTVNFGSLLAERASAKRLFMFVAQTLKYVDATTPVRFLIAECETSFTLLTALYYARMFGIEEKLDISPLFETVKAFERAHRIIEDCLANPHYAAYIRKRGRLCIQTGFSDAGRNLGQTTTAATVELVRTRLADLLADRGFGDIELVIFDTHGESIGRGCHPGSFYDRFAYLASPESQRHFLRRGIKVKQETSYQGGDGWVYFMTPPAALAALTRMAEFALTPPDPGIKDPFYTDYDYVTEFFIAVRQFNERVMNDRCYAALLDAFGNNLIFPSGSRAVRRESEGGALRPDLQHPSQIRAIPHNATLQQLGLLANTIGGVGEAVRKDPERFQRLYRGSWRFRRILSMVEWALEFSDLDVLKAYIDSLDPGLWLQQAAHHSGAGQADELRRLSENLERLGSHDKLARIFRQLQADYLDLAANLAALRAEPDIPENIRGIGEEGRRNLHLLHALRLALIQRVFIMATHIPPFTDRHGISPEQLMTKILHLEIDAAVATLNRIFPATEAPVPIERFGEPASYRSEEAESYEREHHMLFEPMAKSHALIRRIGSAVAHMIGAVG